MQLQVADEGADLENPHYLSKQLITYLGNKRALAAHLDAAITGVRAELGGRKLRAVDLFSGSGFVARLLKQHSSLVIANDMESYSAVVNECYLSNRDMVPLGELGAVVDTLNHIADQGVAVPGFIRELYSPRDDSNIQVGERVFYTSDNARRLDLFAQEISRLPDAIRPFILGPLLSKASIHANTSGVFKGFHKDKRTRIGKFGGSAGDALRRILEPIRLELPVLSNYFADSVVYRRDANELVTDLPELDLAYIDPPYNQHPYGSNYFMLNLLTAYEQPTEISSVAGIPTSWNRSGYNVRQESRKLLRALLERVPSRFVLVSFNSEGYISPDELREDMAQHGPVREIVVPYNTFRGSRNLAGRAMHVREHLFLLDRAR